MMDWEERVRELEEQGLTRSDAQAVVDAEDAKNKPQPHRFSNRGEVRKEITERSKQ